MTHARTPADLHRLFGGALERRDLEALISLFDDEAVLDMGGELVSGLDNLRDALSAYLALDLTMEISTRSVHESGGIALLAAEWKSAPRTNPSLISEGVSVEVARRQPDGRWLFLVDIPSFGAN
ncbi:DUF4440 domain-containing protein (plasmid) [Rhodococcus qingshengii]|uniref:YybH family protein n=1 Tax=Rhodococcus qingshengii TaxID=334542 RepID=UPI002112937C|nr:nuclear transport factor 2 family protein [Rhodococcus qingshengii]UUE28680.1 DUF4440 domain-containing protein [Rhodococcus qingshengii]